MNVGATKTFSAPIFGETCMLASEYTLSFVVSHPDYPATSGNWITYNSHSNSFMATATQAEIDDFCGTSLATYQSNTVMIKVRAVPSYNNAMYKDSHFSVYFENPRTVACQETTLIAPTLDTIITRVSDPPV